MQHALRSARVCGRAKCRLVHLNTAAKASTSGFRGARCFPARPACGTTNMEYAEDYARSIESPAIFRGNKPKFVGCCGLESPALRVAVSRCTQCRLRLRAGTARAPGFALRIWHVVWD